MGTLLNLPIDFFNEAVLAQIILPIRRIKNCTGQRVAKMKIEIDLSKPYTDVIWIGCSNYRHQIAKCKLTVKESKEGNKHSKVPRKHLHEGEIFQKYSCEGDSR